MNASSISKIEYIEQEGYHINIDASGVIRVSQALALNPSIKIRSLSEPAVNLNQSAAHGITIDVLPNYDCDVAINIHYATSSYSTEYFHVLINVDRDSKANLVEHFVDNKNMLCNSVLRINLAEHALLQHYRVQVLDENSKHDSASHIALRPHSSYCNVLLNLGRGLSKHEIHANISEHANCKSRHLSLLSKKAQDDIYWNFHHTAPHSSSNQLCHQVLDDEALGSFYGAISIDKHCANVQATQNSKAMLLSKRAQAFSRPTLNILTDEVKCSHGSVIGAIDEEVLYYLRTRGLDYNQALALVLEGCITEVLSHITDRQIHEHFYNLALSCLEK